MAYPYGGPPGHPAQPLAAYGAPRPQPTGAHDRRDLPETPLVWAVLVLGVATYVINYGPVPTPGEIGWGVRFSTLAALIAALGLLPRQIAHTKVMAALAVMGFLEALSRWIAASGDQNPSWATIVIVVLAALQAMTAVAALLAQLRLPSASDRGSVPYDAYGSDAQAAQQYYAANNQQVQQQPVQAQGTAQAEVAAPAQAQQASAEQYALYTEYLSSQQSGPNAAAPSSQYGGLNQTAQPAAGTGMSTHGPAESIRPRNDPETGSPIRSSS